MATVRQPDACARSSRVGISRPIHGAGRPTMSAALVPALAAASGVQRRDLDALGARRCRAGPIGGCHGRASMPRGGEEKAVGRAQSLRCGDSAAPEPRQARAPSTRGRIALLLRGTTDSDVGRRAGYRLGRAAGAQRRASGARLAPASACEEAAERCRYARRGFDAATGPARLTSQVSALDPGLVEVAPELIGLAREDVGEVMGACRRRGS
jgi:hypothetical protein